MSADWPIVRLGDHCLKIGSGATPRGGASVYLDEGEICLIRSQNVYNDGFKTNGLVYITEESAEKLKNVVVENDDVLLNITGDSVARVCIAKEENLPARVNQHVAIIRPKPNEFDPRYLRYLLASPAMQSLLLTIAAVGATRNALTKNMIETLEVSKPPISIQVEIADYLEAIESKIELNRQTNQTLENIAQVIFKSWFVDFDPTRAKITAKENGQDPELSAMAAIAGKAIDELGTLSNKQFEELKSTAALFPDRLVESELGEIPEGWEVRNFGDVSSCFDSKRIPLSKKQRQEKKPGHIPYYGATSVMDYVNEWIFDDVYLLLGEDGSVIKEDGTPFVQYIWGKSWVNNHAHVLQGKNGVSTEQLMIFIQNQNIASYVTGAVQLKLNQKNMNSIPFLDAGEVLNKRFYDLIAPLYQKVRAKTEQNKTLEDVRDSILPKLLSGEINMSEEAKGEA